MKTTVLSKFFIATLTLSMFFVTSLSAQSGSGGTSGSGSGSGSSAPAPELVFRNPVLKSGTALREGAVYRFPNVTTGVDAEVKLRRFSRPDIVMADIDLAGMGWEKAFQPQFGLPGWVNPWQHWYIDFEMTFFKAGTNDKQKMQKFDLTALDVDGDGNSVYEYVTFDNPYSTTYSTVSYLTNSAVGALGQTFTCSMCSLPSILVSCTNCGGDGLLNSGDDCQICDATGKLHSLCGHPYEEGTGSTVNGPVENFLNIDTLATQVMATYQYRNVDRIRFRYGGKSKNLASYGSGIRLNSTWFRQFSLAPMMPLPVKLSSFTATYKGADVQLNWTSELEESFSHYVIQRSTDGKEFTDLAMVMPVGGSRGQYNYKDRNVTSSNGAVYYRILMVDQTKESRASEVRVVRLGKEAQSITLSTYPNPVTDQVRITLPASWQGKRVALELYNSNGVQVQNIQFGNASQTETMQVGKVARGMYIVKAVCEGETAQQRIVKN
jgi:hypothetical protein